MCWVLLSGPSAVPKGPDPLIGLRSGQIGELDRLRTADRYGGCTEIHRGYRTHFDRLGNFQRVIAAGAGGNDQLNIVGALCGIRVCGTDRRGGCSIAQIPLVSQHIVDRVDIGHKLLLKRQAPLYRYARYLYLGSSYVDVVRLRDRVFAPVLTGYDQSNGERSIDRVRVGAVSYTHLTLPTKA